MTPRLNRLRRNRRSSSWADMRGSIYHDVASDPQSREVIQLLPKDYSAAGGVLSRAFLNGPLWLALMSDPQTRQTKLAQMFTGLAKATAAANGVAETTSG